MTLAGLAPENPLEITLSASHSADALRKERAISR